MKWRILAAWACLGLVGIAHAGPTGCCVIPIADILRHREAFFGYTIGGTERNVDKSISHANYLTIGLFDRIEFGYDNDFNRNTVYNAKVLLWEAPKTGQMAVSAGFQNWDGKGYLEPYVVGRYDLPFCRLHLGALRDDRWRLIAGTDFPLFGSCTGAIDFMSGPGARMWTSFSLPVPKCPGLALTFFAGFPMQRSEGIQWMVDLNWKFRF
jgi:hypothetical protein